MSLSNPYIIDLPGVVSFSGGRTSGYMLYHIVEAFGGQPDDLKICFQNTGLEHPATYDFIHECEERWGLDMHWLEYSLTEEGKPSYREVDYETSSRKGEPFSALIAHKQYLPNPIARLCTANLKMFCLEKYLKSWPAFTQGYTNAVGLRYDEPRRVHRMRGEDGQATVACPLYDAKHTEEDVLAWWEANDFDLHLPLKNNLASNCVGCFLKGRQKLELLMLEHPEHFEWWIKAEQTPLNSAPAGGRFRNDRPSYGQMKKILDSQGWLFDPTGPDEDTIPCFCTD